MLTFRPLALSSLATVITATSLTVTASESTHLETLQVTGQPLPDQELTTSDLDKNIRSVYRLDLDAIDHPATRIEDLAFTIPGAQEGVQDSGFSTSMIIRGFPVTRPDYNGLPDIQRLFVRDLHTVESIEILSGPDAIMRGISSPGGSIRYIGKLPEFERKTTVGAQLSSYQPFQEHNGSRLTLDTTGPLGEQVAYRLVAASQDIDLQPNDTAAQRNHVLGGLTWQYHDLGEIRLESEYQENRQPYLFGTVITSEGEPIYNHYFHSPDQESKRQYKRHAVDWQQRWKPSEKNKFKVSGRYAHSEVKRQDELIGFWSRLDDETLSGYYTDVADDYQQTSWQLQLDWKHDGALSHRGLILLDQHTESFTLDRTQSLWDSSVTDPPWGDWAFFIKTDNPNFQPLSNDGLQPINAKDAFSTSWQDKNENTTQGLAAAYQIGTHWGQRNVDWTVGLRYNEFEQTYARNSDQLPVVMKADGLSWQWGFRLDVTENLQFRLAQGLSRQVAANGRRDKEGSFLPPEENLLSEISLAYAQANQKAQITVYHIEKGKIAEADQSVSNEEISDLGFTPFKLTGSQTSMGLEGIYQYSNEAFYFSALASYLETTDDRRGFEGSQFPGVAKSTGSLTAGLHKTLNNGAKLRPWYSLRYVGKRYADTANEVEADAFLLHSLGLSLTKENSRISLVVNNLLDEEYVSYLSSTDTVYQGDRRRIWLSMETTF
ncbi:iron complex outermembrane recepter protein [Marinospirillum celere]|uniref:Iron complex outermembrane recepter protein n=1 Tax=Marinospirillum celere TaxID=1122252 RepID=A0A1I1G8J9_9GAMM|nr:TonB-dependent receptor [Marinospirillum celere]SFC05683.1 iron complex outermembrane recepter protein [Marinospirillum celere]